MVGEKGVTKRRKVRSFWAKGGGNPVKNGDEGRVKRR